MKKVILIGIVSLSILFNSCNNTDTPNPAPVSTDKALSPSGVEDERMFIATGEVVIFFQPSRDRMSSWKGNQDSLQKSLQDFTNAFSTAQKTLAEMGISSYTTDKADVKVNISEQKFFVVNAAASQDGFGFIMTKLGEQPKVSLGAFTSEQVLEQAKAFYKK
jgi:hypothetical protein